jgi:hypothetical protein
VFAEHPVDGQGAEVHLVVAEFGLVRKARQARVGGGDLTEDATAVVVDGALVVIGLDTAAARAGGHQRLVEAGEGHAGSGRVADLELRELLRLLEFAAFPLSRDAQRIRCVPGQLATEGAIFALGTFLAGQHVIEVAVDCVTAYRQSTGQGVGDRSGDDAGDLLLAVTAIQRRNAALELLRGLCGNDVDSPADRVLAKEDALGATKYLDAVEIHEGRARELVPAHVDPVVKHGDGQLDALVDARRADAADKDEVADGTLGDVHRRYVDGKFSAATDTHLLQIFTAFRQHGDGDVLHAFGAPRGGYDDLLELRPGKVSGRQQGERYSGAENARSGHPAGRVRHDVFLRCGMTYWYARVGTTRSAGATRTLRYRKRSATANRVTRIVRTRSGMLPILKVGRLPYLLAFSASIGLRRECCLHR